MNTNNKLRLTGLVFVGFILVYAFFMLLVLADMNGKIQQLDDTAKQQQLLSRNAIKWEQEHWNDPDVGTGIATNTEESEKGQ